MRLPRLPHEGGHLKDIIPKRSIIEAIRQSLAEKSTIVDIEISFNADPDEREAVITDMFMAGYKLRGDTLNTLTFQKEFI